MQAKWIKLDLIFSSIIVVIMFVKTHLYVSIKMMYSNLFEYNTIKINYDLLGMAYFVRGSPNQARENPALLYNWLPTITFLAQQ